MFRNTIAALLTAAPALVAAAPSIADFAQHPSIENVQLSPDGTYVATKVYFKNGPGLAIIRLADNKVTAHITMGNSRDLADFWWVSPSRVVVAPALYWGGYEAPFATGELEALDADGDGQDYLFGYNGNEEVASHLPSVKIRYASAKIIKTLPDDPQHAVVEVNNWETSSEDHQYTEAYKLNVANGLLTGGVTAPIAGYTDFLADWTGAVRYAVGIRDVRLLTYFREPGKNEWQPVNASDLKDARVEPLAFSRDNSKVYLRSDEGEDRYCLVEQTLATGTRHKLSCDPEADLSDVIFSFDGKEPIAAIYASDKPRIVPLDTDNPDKTMLQRLQLSFPGEIVVPVSKSTDGSKLVLYVYSDRDPGAYYLFDTKAVKASLIGARFERIDPEEMGERRPVTFKARDGKMLHAYLTIPPGHSIKNLPLVVFPHGGPIGIADTWRWNADAQVLATHGYAVLQINYRGSGGYGSTFEKAGHQAWDTVIIDDIMDGTRWAVDQGIADAKRLCIFGASYGGYAALMSAEREPDLYRCAVGYAGVYDLKLLRSDSDITDSREGREAFEIFIGASPERLQKASPITYVDRLKAAVMIVHGTEDQRAPFTQAKALRKALDVRHYPYEWLEKSGEGHGFYALENRAEFYTKLLAFLDRNIGSASGPSPESSTSAGTAPAAATASTNGVSGN